MTLKAELLGPPRFHVDDIDLVFPFRKVEAMACYLLVERKATRETLMDLFWGDRDGDLASRNLRNALYELRKIFPPGVILSQGQQVLVGDGVSLDIDDIGPETADAFASCPVRPFLEGFSLPSCPRFEEWLRQTRSLFDRRRRRLMRDLGLSRLEGGAFDGALSCLEPLFAADDLDEEAARLLMTAYAALGRRRELIRVYGHLEERLREELAVAPSPETVLLCESLLSQDDGALKPTDETPAKDLFFGRVAELREAAAFLAPSGALRSLFVSGEAGVGKSLFVAELLHSLAGDILTLRCGAVRSDERHPLLPWNDLLEDLASRVDIDSLDFPPALRSLLAESFPSLATATTAYHPAGPERLGVALARLFDSLSGRRPLAVVFEDLQWFDDESFEVLESFLLHRPGPLLVVATTRHRPTCRGREIFRSCSRAGRCRLKEMELSRFSRPETEAFCRRVLPEGSLDEEGLIRLYGLTDGLPLFLARLLRLVASGRSLDAVPDSLAEVLEERLDGLSQEERSLLEHLAIFTTRAEWDLLRRFTGLSEAALTGLVEGLREADLLAESLDEGDRLHIVFSHDLVREHLYRALSEARRRLLHGRMARVLMDDLGDRRWNDLLCSRIIGHCRRASMDVEEMEYSLRKLKLHIHLNYELFPLLSDEILRSASSAFEGKKYTREQLNGLRRLLQSIRRDRGPTEEVARLEAAFQAISGGYLLWWGDYGQGRLLVDKALQWARQAGQDDLVLDCLQHLCYYAIQIEEGALLERQGRLLLEAAAAAGREPFRGAGLRFFAMGQVFQGNYGGGAGALRASIDRFLAIEALDEPYTLQVAAAQNYLGDIAHRQGRLREALALYQASIDRCADEGIYRGLCCFHSNAAHVAFDLGDENLFESHLAAAQALQGGRESWRGNGVLFSLLALSASRRGDETIALEALSQADRLANDLKKRFWQALQLEVKGRIKGEAPEGSLLGQELDDGRTYLEGALGHYQVMAMSHKIDSVRAALTQRGASAGPGTSGGRGNERRGENGKG